MPPEPAMAAETSFVADVQQKLNVLGYEAGPNDGLMGPRTRKAIRAFQKDAGLPVTGEIDSELLTHLESSAGLGQAVEDPETVLRVEKKLDSLGWAVGEVDGKVDDQLRNRADQICAVRGPSRQRQPDDGHGQSRRSAYAPQRSLNSASRLLWSVETELTQRGYLTGPIDGTTDQYTFRAILDYEEDNGLPRNGQLNPILLDSLEIADTRPVTDLDLRQIESRLLKQGYAPGAVDGVLDAQTEAAIKEYQTDAGQAPTGQPSMILLSDLGRSNTLSNSFVAEHGELYPGRRTD